MPSLSRTLRPTPLGWVYVIGIAGLATYGFTTESTAAILLAAAATLPMSIVALPAYYVVYGLLAQVPGANPSSGSSGGSTCSADGVCQGWSTGDPAAWFETTTSMLGILILASAALLNVVMLRGLVALSRRRSTGETPADRDPAPAPP